VLLGGGGFTDGDAGGFRSDTGLDEVVGQGVEVAAGHVDDQRGIFGEGSGPFWCDLEFARGMVGSGEDELGGGGAIRKGCPEAGGYGEGGGYAGDDFERDTVVAKEGDLFAGAAEDEWVTGFEAEDGAVGGGVLEHEGVDLGLRDAGLAAALAYGDYFGGGAGEGENLVGDEVVGKDNVSGLEELDSTQGEETWVSGACSCKVDGARLGFFVHDFFSGIGLVRACSRAKVREGH
jgi:hypothetical protein